MGKNYIESYDESQKEEEIHLCFMTNHEENEMKNLTFEFTYNELLLR